MSDWVLVALNAELDMGIAMNWIDVNESLPQVGIDSVYGSAWLLVAYIFDGKQIVGEGKFVKTPKNPYWRNVFSDKIDVTHWMLLPQPPMIGV